MGQVARELPPSLGLVEPSPMTVSSEIQKLELREQAVEEVGLEAALVETAEVRRGALRPVRAVDSAKRSAPDPRRPA